MNTQTTLSVSDVILDHTSTSVDLVSGSWGPTPSPTTTTGIGEGEGEAGFATVGDTDEEDAGKSRFRYCFIAILLYTGGVLFHVEWCIRKP